MVNIYVFTTATRDHFNSPRCNTKLCRVSSGSVLLGYLSSPDIDLFNSNKSGVAESGLFPGVVFYLSMWYKRSEQHYRISLFFSAASLAGAFGGVLAWGIAHMKGVGGYNGWRWIFIIVGALARV